ncbi:hypothetical protein GE21DRAFT_1061390 [Neurospora crassa]|nr:hypothetical protein GE21DRAFT_1061390 [Neurospora crassa]
MRAHELMCVWMGIFCVDVVLCESVAQCWPLSFALTESFQAFLFVPCPVYYRKRKSVLYAYLTDGVCLPPAYMMKDRSKIFILKFIELTDAYCRLSPLLG